MPETSQRRDRGWLPQLVEGLLVAAHTQRCHAMLVNPHTTSEAEFDRLVAGRPLGCVIIASPQRSDEDEAVLARLHDAGVSVVLFGEEIHSPGHDMVTGDHTAGARLLTEWLAHRGCRRILRYWPYRITRQRRPPWLGHRDEGYEAAIHELGLEVLPALECPRPELTGLNEDDYFATRVRHTAGFLAEHVLGNSPVDGILTPTDRHAYEVAAACRVLGLEPNKDVLIAGYDGDWQECPERKWESIGPAVTIKQDDASLGRRMVDVLLNRVESQDLEPSLTQIEPLLVEVAP